MKLTSMVNFVLLQNKNTLIKDTYINRTIAYANFLQQHLTLGMFIPCDEDGNTLEWPKHYDNWLNGTGINYDVPEDVLQWTKLCNQYDIALESILFEGFVYGEVKRILYDLPRVMHGSHIEILERDMESMTVESIISEEISLTPTAQNQIGL